jgi:hypothetical protein
MIEECNISNLSYRLVENRPCGGYIEQNLIDWSFPPKFNLFPSLDKFIIAFFIICGIFFLGKLFWACVYEYRNKGDGEKYLSGELKRSKKK